MILTEEEAKTKWCPHVRIPADNVGGGINRDSAGNTVRATCIASECMAWRWVTLCDGENSFPREKGYCGLAGNPND